MLRSAIYLIFCQLATGAIGALTWAVVNRSLGPAGRGDYAELLAWANILTSVFGLSVSAVTFHFARQEQYPYSRQQLVGTVLATWLVQVTLAAAGAWAVTIALPGVLSPNVTASLWLVLLLMACTMALGLHDALLKIAGTFRAVAVVLITVALMGLGISAVLAFLHALTAQTALLALAAAQLVGALCYLGLLVRLPGWHPFRFARNLLQPLIRAGLKLHVATVCTLLYVRVDQVLVHALAGSEQTGYYSVSVTTAMQAMLVPMAIQQLLYSRLASASARDASRISVLATRLAAIGLGICLLSVAALSGPIIDLLAGASYGASVPLLLLLLPGIWCFGISNLLSPFCVRAGKFGVMSATSAVLLVVNMALNWVLIPQHAAAGAAIATDVTYAVGAIASLAMFSWLGGDARSLFRLSRQDIDLIRTELVGLRKTFSAVG